MNTVDVVQWIATIIQLIGYVLTRMNIVLWNVSAFVIGIALWFAVGMMWKDKAIMVVHVGEFFSLVGGIFASIESDFGFSGARSRRRAPSSA